MPKTTFFNLPDKKQKSIISAAIDEFSKASYNSASINQICKNSNIAKGSFYQYFTDKLDLYVYIITLAIEEKIKFFSSVLTEFQSLSLLEQIRMLFVKGVEFAKLYPLYAALGEQFSKENDEIAVSAVLKEGYKQSESLFMKMIDKAKSKGEINKNVDSYALNIMLQSMNNSVSEFMKNKYGEVNYEKYDEDVNNFIDSTLYILFHGIKNN
jgi:AcrR family transcriptional regulator